MDAALIVPLSEAKDVRLVGGKAAELGKMIQAGFNVPNGFVVTTQAFRNMTPALKKKILENLDHLGAAFVAVRSSAVGEDGAHAAWAGQLETYLNTTKHDLIENIRKCWESIDSSRAKAYAEQKSLVGGRVGVVVQKMVQSTVSGVAFSVHPITQDQQHMVIEAGLGLGEAVVSGYITPDTYVVHKKTGRAVEKHVSDQSAELSKDSVGETSWHHLQQGARQKLSDAQITKLSMVIREIEAYFKRPVDVEWALHGEAFYILQSRPITTLVLQ